MPKPLDDRDRALLFGDEALSEGDAVVHFEHGLARYGGETTVEVEGAENRLTVFIYRNGGKLMLPAREGHDFWAYGAPADDVTLDRLNAGDWTARRDEMIAELRRGADALIAEDAERRAHEAPVLRPDAAAMDAFAATFGHEPTPDQARAIAGVLEDLADGVPMNRLLVGDVGYGKTEVALRAVAAAVLSGRQAAFVAPTTVLVRQHADTLRRRFPDVRIAELSRLTPAGEREETVGAIASGAARIVVGTQALLGEDVSFADLALTVIDEEQKFGREEKDALRARARGAHVLSMTATPIPRSLAAAEIGLLDLSVIATAPEARRPVETRVAPRSARALREAVAAEIARGGQAHVVTPRIEGLAEAEAMLTEGPDAPRHALAHGQMPEGELEARMAAFAAGEVDVLVSTSIVESGLDTPRANAMVVLGADLFGLTQLHQLRGRIGRSDVQAHMLLMSDAAEDGEAARRLAAFAEMSEMGAGFRIARLDRDMRGFGALDGDAQSGHVSRLGLGLYRHVLRTHARLDEGAMAA